MLSLLLLAITKLHARLGQYCVKLHYGIVLGTLSLLLFAITKLRARLGQCCVKLHYGIVLGMLSLLLLAITKLRRKLVRCYTKSAPWDSCGDAIVSSSSFKEVATTTQSQAQPPNGPNRALRKRH